MNCLMRLLVTGTLAGSTALFAQNFSGSDDFSSVVAGNWSASDTTAGGGAFTVSGGALNFTDGGLTSGQTSSAARNWILNAGSSTADWQVQVDLSLNLTQVAGQISNWNLLFTNSADAVTTPDYFQVEFLRSYMQLNPFVRGTLYTDGSMGTSAQQDVTSSATVRASYLASTQTLSLAYDADGATGGYAFTNLYSSSVASWGMGAGDTFVLNLGVSNLTNASATSAVSLGQIYADNFAASPTAPIPEPATYAAALGLVGLIAAGLRRRLGQE